LKKRQPSSEKIFLTNPLEQKLSSVLTRLNVLDLQPYARLKKYSYKKRHLKYRNGVVNMLNTVKSLVRQIQITRKEIGKLETKIKEVGNEVFYQVVEISSTELEYEKFYVREKKTEEGIEKEEYSLRGLLVSTRRTNYEPTSSYDKYEGEELYILEDGSLKSFYTTTEVSYETPYHHQIYRNESEENRIDHFDKNEAINKIITQLKHRVSKVDMERQSKLEKINNLKGMKGSA
jgi:hypothetical protein